MQKRLKVIGALLLLGQPAFGADHIDGSNAVNNPEADITDLYVFKAPRDEGKLVIVLDAVLAVLPNQRPDSSVLFDVMIKSATPDESGFQTSSDYSIRCFWDNGEVGCESTIGTKVTVAENEMVPAEPTLPIRLFAGMRSDPFFLNGIWEAKLAASNEIPDATNFDALDQFNVLSLIFEIDIKAELSELSGPLYAVAAQTLDIRSGQTIDWIGRPEITNVALLAAESDLRDPYNALGPFSSDTDALQEFSQRLQDNIERYSQIGDGSYAVDKAQLAAVLLDDFLLVDVSKPCANAFFFEIEFTHLKGERNETCGGRHMNEDAIDAIYSLMITGDPHPTVHDGTVGATQPSTDIFPYLAEPNTGPSARLKAYAGRLIGNLSAPGSARTKSAIGILGVLAGLLLLVGGGIRKLIRARKRSR